MTRSRVLCLVLSLLLSACGGGDPVADDAGQAQPATVPVKAAPSLLNGSAPVAAAATTAVRAAYTGSAIKVVLYGDSTEAGNYAGTNNAAILQYRYDKSGRDIQIWEEAVGGTTALQLLTGSDREHVETFDQTVARTSAQIVGFRYSINDSRFYDAEVFRSVLVALTRMAEDAGKIVILQTPSLVDLSPQGEALIRANVRVIREVAAAHPNTVLCDHRKVANVLGYQNVDAVHPTAFDYRRRQSLTLQECVEAAIAKLPA